MSKLLKLELTKDEMIFIRNGLGYLETLTMRHPKMHEKLIRKFDDIIKTKEVE